jgi:hypothetical protein
MSIKRAIFSGLSLTVLAFAALAIAPGTASATAISITSISGAGSGLFSINNLTATMVGVSNSCIDFGYPAACQTATGIPDSVTSTDPTNFTSGSTASDTIKDLPAAVLLPLVDFQTVQSPLSGGEVFFDLTGFTIPGAFGNCTTFALNASCNPGGGSPFILTQNSANQVTVGFAVTEIAYTGTSTSGSTPYDNIFTTQLSGELPNGNPDTIPNILNYISTSGNTITSTWSASESPVVAPEPLSFVLFGSGLAGLALFGRRRRSRSK